MSEWPLDRGARVIFCGLKKICLFWWCIDHPEEKRRKKDPCTFDKATWDMRRAIWVMGWLFVLVVLWLWNPGSFALKIIIGVLAAWRLFEVAVTGLGTALNDDGQVRARSMITIGIYAFQLTFAFAILYHSFAATQFAAGEGATGPAHDATDYLYISWANITSLGTDSYVPTNDAARFLEVLTTTFGILLLGVLLAFGINDVKKSRRS